MMIHICNNNDSGDWTRRFSQVEFMVKGEVALRLETIFMQPVTADCFDPSWAVQLMRIYGITVKFTCIGNWTGNMRWNTIEMLDYYALGFLRALQLSGEWGVTDGWKTLFEKFDQRLEITGADFEMNEDIQPRVVHPNQLGIKF